VIRLQHLVHPARTAKVLWQYVVHRATMPFYGYVARRKTRSIARAQRNQCWCGGELLPFRLHPEYGQCAICSCYVARRPPLPEGLATLYSLDYWHVRQRMRGHPPIEARGDLYRIDGRLDYWLGLVAKYGPAQGRAIEIGCAPGVLLAELQRRGYECIGVEVDPGVADWIRCQVNVDVREGQFPGLQLPTCDLFLAFDVLEHIPDPEGFVRELQCLLRPGGVAIIQTPIERHDYERPFGRRREFFDDLEHLFLFTDKSIVALAALSGLRIVNLEDCMNGLGQVCVLSKS